MRRLKARPGVPLLAAKPVLRRLLDAGRHAASRQPGVADTGRARGGSAARPSAADRHGHDEHPGVVAEGPVGMPEGSVLFAGYESVRIPGHKDPRIAEGNGADGLAIDGEGRAYAATNRGVEVFSPQGQHLGTIPVIWGVEQAALRKPANLAFAGRDRKTLYTFGAGGTAFKVQMLAQGFKGRAKQETRG